MLPSDNNNPIIKTIKFPVGDLVTRGLLAVSQVCALGAGVWFGPGSEFRSCIVWDKEAFVASAGPKTELTMKNCTYLLPSREVFKNDVIGGVEGEAEPLPGQEPGSGSADASLEADGTKIGFPGIEGIRGPWGIGILEMVVWMIIVKLLNMMYLKI